MADVDKCADCGKRGATVYKKDKWGKDDLRSAPRCTLCATHFELAVAYKRKYYTQAFKADCQRRDHAMTARAKRNRKRAKHCPSCHGYRAAEAFLKGAGAFGHCQLCRDIETARDRGVGGMSTMFRAGTAKEIVAKVRAMRDDTNRILADGAVAREVARVESTTRARMEDARKRMERDGRSSTFIAKMMATREQSLATFREKMRLKDDAPDAEYAQQLANARAATGGLNHE